MPNTTLLGPRSAVPDSRRFSGPRLVPTVPFVFITSELLLIADYPVHHAHRLRVIAYRHRLIPHTLARI